MAWLRRFFASGGRQEGWAIPRFTLPTPGLRRPFYGWAVVLVALLATFSSGPGQSFTFSVFVDPMLAETRMSRTTISALYAVGTGFSAAMTLLVSRMVDRYGARMMLVCIGLALGAACLGMSLAHGPLAFLLGFAALRALGQGSLPVTATLLTAQWFVRYRGRAMALANLGISLSNAILPPLARYLIEAFGWRGAYQALGIMVWVLLVPAALLVVRNRPEAVGLHPDGLADAPSYAPGEDPDAVPQVATVVWRTARFWQLALPLAVAPFVVTALVFHQISILGERGMGPQVATAIFAPFSIAATLMIPLLGFAIERFSPRLLLRANLGLMLLALLMLQFASSPLTAVLYAICLGAAGGGQGVIASVIWAHYYGRRGLGKLQGTAGMIMITSAAVAPLPLAALQQASGSYTLGLGLLALLPIAGMLLVTRFSEASRVQV